MLKEYTLRQHIERNGLILIALFMIIIYWIIDSLVSNQIMTRVLVACLVITYGIFTQTLINSRKAALEEKERTQKQLIQSEKLAALGIVAAGIAHEVKNPLAIIIQGVEYLRTSIDSDIKIADIVDRIKRSAFRADAIIKGLLSFTRQMPIQTEQVQISPVIEETLSLIEHQLKSKHIKLVKHLSPVLPKVTVDGNQIKQVFLNLLLNSIDAIEDNGTITLSAEKIEGAPGKSYLQITFADTGCGIPKDKIEKVFDPFYTTKDGTGNAGLGLSIVKGIIDKHHGAVRIESEPGGGTRVIIALPAGNANEADSNLLIEENIMTEQIKSKAAPEKKKILLIDDEEDFCFFVKLNLEKTGRFQVLTTTSGSSGLVLASKERPDLILLDIIMPEMGGGQVAELLFENPKTRKIPVLFITAIASRQQVQSQEGIIGGRNFIAKPVTPDELMAKIDGIFKSIK